MAESATAQRRLYMRVTAFMNKTATRWQMTCSYEMPQLEAEDKNRVLCTGTAWPGPVVFSCRLRETKNLPHITSNVCVLGEIVWDG